MIEGIPNSPAVLPRHDITPSGPIQIPAPDAKAANEFNSVLKTAEGSDTKSLSIESNKQNAPMTHPERPAIDKLVSMDKSYQSMLKEWQGFNPRDRAQASKRSSDAPAIRTLDNQRPSADSSIRTNHDGQNSGTSGRVSFLQNLFDSKLDAMKNTSERFNSIMAWSTNMSVFSAALKSTSTGFKTLFRSAG